jgi:hypothetical protein
MQRESTWLVNLCRGEFREVGGDDVLFFVEAQLTADIDLFQG